MRKMTLTLSAVVVGYAAYAALLLLRDILPLLGGGDNVELVTKSGLLLLVIGYAILQWHSLRAAKPVWLWLALVVNVVVLLPLGVTAVLCHWLGGEKIMRHEDMVLGLVTALAAAIAISCQAMALITRSGTR